MDKRLMLGIANVFSVFLLIAVIVPSTTALPPVANFTSQEIGCYVVEFNGSASFDPEGNISNHTWDFGTGESPRFVSDTGPPTTITHTFAGCGLKVVELSVGDDEGNYNSTVKIIRVSCELVARFTSQEIGCYVVEFNGSASCYAEGNISNHTWDFGAGESPRFVSDTGPPTTITHTFASCGLKTVQLSVGDDEGNYNSTVKIIRVSCEPVANFTSQEIGCYVVEFNGSAMVDSASRSIANHSWDFGDGQIVGDAGPPTTIIHTYATCGPKVVTLTVYDDLGCHDQYIEIIDVNCSCGLKVPLLSPLGLIALVGLLATIAFVTTVRKRH